MTHENAGIQIKDVSKKLGRKPILNGINLYVQPGETVGIIGTNGSGKSTLLRIIAGLMYPDQGQVTINGEQIKPGFVGNIPSSIGVLIEHPAFLPQFSGLQNLLMLAEIRNIIEKQDVIDILRKVGLDPDNRKPVKSYSLGMRQRLGIAQAIMEKPHVLLLDEPTNGLDQSGIELFSTLLQEQIDRGAAVLLVSHQKDDINRYCDHVYKMEDGALALSAEQRTNKWLAVLEDMSELERMYQLEPSMQLTERVDGHPTCIVQGPWKNGDELKSYMQVNGIAVREIKEWSA